MINQFFVLLESRGWAGAEDATLSPTVPHSCAWQSTAQQRYSSSELEFWDFANTWGEAQELWLQILALPQSPCCNWGDTIAMIPFPIC